MNLVPRAADWLRSNHIIVNEDWLRACVEWIQEENRERDLSDNDINSQVYEQWLLSDLHELETSCLPAELLQAQKYELQGTYTLQIDSIVDVGVSFYSQQQKLKGTENANVHVNAEEPTQKPWEAKPSRMLMFKITDGTHNVQGMEYRPISCLNPQTSPGSKILVYGTVLCRQGILMLSESNIKFLGGEVDTLVEVNTVANTLQSAMDASEEHAGKEHKQQFSGSEIRHNKQPVTSGGIKTGTQGNCWNSSTGNVQNRNQSIGSRGQQFGKIKVEQVTQDRSADNNYQQNNQGDIDYDALLDDDMDDLMQEMNTDDFDIPKTNIPSLRNSESMSSRLAVAANNNNNNASEQNQDRSNKIRTAVNPTSGNGIQRLNGSSGGTMMPNHSSSLSSNASHSGMVNDLAEMEFEDDTDFANMDEDFETVPENYVANMENTCDVQKNVKDTFKNLNVYQQGANKKSARTGSLNEESRDVKKTMLRHNVADKFPANSDCNGTNSAGMLNLINGSKAVMLNNVDMIVDVSKQGIKMSINSGNTTAPNTNTKVMQMDQSSNVLNFGNNSGNISEGSGKVLNIKTETPSKLSGSSNNQQGRIDNFFPREAEIPSTAGSSRGNQQGRIDNFFPRENEIPSMAGSSKGNQQETIKSFFTPDKILKIKEEQSQTVKSLQQPDIQSEYPFTYLKKVMSLPVQTQPSYHTVKAYISTLTSKLTSVDGKWSLTCKINDGSMAADVDLSSQVLTEMIGFSPQEAQVMKQRVRTDPNVKQVLQEGIQQCQQKLIELMCLLELEICARNPRPVIVATKQLTSNHIELLYNRVMGVLHP